MSTLDRPTPDTRTATDALAAIGLNGPALLRIANRIANDYTRRTGATLGDKHEDFTMHLVETGLKAALRYNPALAQGEQGTSFVWKIMERRCDDFFRSKAQGFGDRRYGNDNRLVLTDQTEEFDHNIDFDNLLSERRAVRWHQAAGLVDTPISEWIVITLDRAANDLLKKAA